MEPLSREALRARLQAQGHDCSDDEIDLLLPVLERTLPLIAAIAAVPADDEEPAVEFRMEPRP